jgi:anti-sigma regulatory factor (Ser/Thr protein kinase)
VLVISELATNAVQHAHSDFTVSLSRADGSIVVTVGDSNPTTPRSRANDPAAPGGRGLSILDAATSRWGHRPVAGGKLIWAELTSQPAAL